MTYNTQRERMRLPEYGRCVAEMVAHLRTIEDRGERQRCAEAVVSIMANMNPQLREQPDFMQRVWDHLAYISDYQLDIDYPFPLTRLDDEASKPEPLAYPSNKIRQRQYGHIIEAMLHKLAEMPEGEERDELTGMVANQMKQSLFIWNRDAMDNDRVASDISAYTEGRVSLDLDTFRFSPVQTVPRQIAVGKKKKK